MKKLLAACAVILAVLIAGNVYRTSDAAKMKRWSKELGVPLKDGQIVQYADSHGGFLGDGMTKAVIQFSDSEVLEEIEKQWESVPLTENLAQMAYGAESEEFYRNPLIQNEDGTPFFPKVTDGYYWFMDRYSQSADPRDDSDLLNRHSYNFTLAVYDSGSNKLYYAVVDT